MMHEQTKKKYQIFISSTFSDLKEERQAIQDVILKMNHFPVGMELFSAASEDQWSVIERTINNTDYYVLVIGYRYGSLTEEGISYTQKEYTYAKEHDIPILAFIKKEGLPSTEDKREDTRTKKKQLLRFTEDVKTGRYVKWWSSKEELEKEVMSALYQQFDVCPRPGWIRSDSTNSEEIQLELVKQNQKIRALQEENALLKEKAAESRYPEFELLINNSDTLDIELPVWGGSNEIYSEYMPINIEEYKDKNVSAKYLQECEDYNLNLPTQEVLEEYINNKRLYDLSRNHAIPVSFIIENIGNCVAKGVCVDLEFPESVIIYNQDILDSLNEPEAPYREIHPDGEGMRALMALSKRMNNDIFANHSLLAHLSVDRDDGEYLENNKLDIRRDQIIHTRHVLIDNYFIVPLEKGEFEIKAYIICEELREEQEFSIPLIIR